MSRSEVKTIFDRFTNRFKPNINRFAKAFDFLEQQAKNAADPTDDQDLVTKAYGDANYVGGGGVSEFTELDDTPANYTGESGKYLAVNAGEDAVEFVDEPVPDPSDAGDILYSADGSSWIRLGVGSADQVLTVSGGVPSWEDAGGGDGGFPETLQFWDDFASSPIESTVDDSTWADGVYWRAETDGVSNSFTAVDNGSWIGFDVAGGEGSDGWNQLFFGRMGNGNGWQSDQNFYMDIRVNFNSASGEFFLGFTNGNTPGWNEGSITSDLLGFSWETGDTYLNIEQGNGTRAPTTTSHSATTRVFRIHVQANTAPELPSVTLYMGTTESNLVQIGYVEYTGTETEMWYPYLTAWSSGTRWQMFVDYVKIYADRGDPGSPHGGG